MTSLRRLRAAATRQFLLLRNRKAFTETFLPQLPEHLRPAASLVFLSNFTKEELDVASRIEGFRGEIPTVANSSEIHSFASPRSGTFQHDAQDHAVPGPYVSNSAELVARTGADKVNGILLRRLVDGLGTRTVFELGTNTGLSGCYFLSTSTVESLITVEGSADLCAIAEVNLKRLGSSFTIMNTLFDDAIDQLHRDGKTVDCVFIDGQHEREATWHYVRHVLPILASGGSIIFDDIYWSEDMNRMWQEVSASELFSLTLDLRYKGLAVRATEGQPKVHFDVCEYMGRPIVSRSGW